MRVSPVGLYATSLDEALHLAKLASSVSHNHPEGIKGAQAVAACVYLKKMNASNSEIKEYIETKFGYDLDVKLETIRPRYSFDVTCQGSVPIAIMSFLQRENTEGVLRLAISMGGDSDTIGCMACAISMAGIYRKEYSLDATQKELIKHCETLLPEDLLEINDRFEALIRTNRINEE